MLSKEAFDKRSTMFWVPASQLLRLGEFTRHQEAYRIRAITPGVPPIPLFISHRWADPRLADPDGRQHHIIIRFILESICLSKGLCERFFSYSEPEIVLNQSLRDQIRDHQPTGGGMIQPDWAGEWRSDDVTNHTPMLLARWIRENFPFLQLDAEELIAIAEVFDDVGVWYDNMCMPQRPFMNEGEEQSFRWHLSKLSSFITSSHVLVIWDKDSNDRGWCLLEGIIADAEGLANYDAIPNTNWKIAMFDLGKGYSGLPPNKQIALYLRQVRETLAGKTLAEIRTFFDDNRIVCTHPEDLDSVCKLLLDYFNQRLPRPI